jgi:hypothetical protein
VEENWLNMYIMVISLNHMKFMASLAIDEFPTWVYIQLHTVKPIESLGTHLLRYNTV